MNFFATDKNTTIAGILAFISLLAGQLQFLWDTDPVSAPDWTLIVSSLFVLIGLFKAKDAGKNISE